MSRSEFIYADNAATTPVSDAVLKAMTPYFQEEYGNPSSIYAMGRKAGKDLSDARKRVADTLGAKEKEIFFTSGGSEADNWAIKGGAALQGKKGKKHIITTIFEHHAVLHTLEALEKEGYKVTYLPVEENGIVSISKLKEAIREDTGLVTIMYANNEIGTIQPIVEIGALCKEKDILFHTDAVQAIGAVDINVKEQNIDMLSLSGHKINASKGIGVLYIRQGLRLPNLIHGGAQEMNRRAGTENTPAIMGLAQAIEDATVNIADKNKAMREKSQYMMDDLLKLPHTRLNGDRYNRLASNLNISFSGIEGESLLLLLDNAGIAASSGSACTSGSLDPSHVLLALGMPVEVAHGSLRVTISPRTTMEDVEYIVEQVKIAVARLREMSPLWDHIINETA